MASPPTQPPSATKPARVALFVTCLVDLVAPEVGDATVALLRHAGVAVDFPPSQTCCGQPPFNSGFHDDARRLARTMLDAFEDAEAVVSPSGISKVSSCQWNTRSPGSHTDITGSTLPSGVGSMGVKPNSRTGAGRRDAPFASARS